MSDFVRREGTRAAAASWAATLLMASAQERSRSPGEAAPLPDPREDVAAHLLAGRELDPAGLAVELDVEVEDRAALVLLHDVRVAAQRDHRKVHLDRRGGARGDLDVE